MNSINNNTEFITKLSAALVFPFLYISTVFVSQPTTLMVLFGQFFGWVALSASFILIYQLIKNILLLLILFFLLTLFKLLLLIDSSTQLINYYVYLLNFIYSLSGCIVANNFSKLIYKITASICVINVFIMVLQIVGIDSWTQFLTTHGEDNHFNPVKTIFISEEKLEFSLIQYRPAGISHSTIVLNLLIIYLIITYYLSNKNKNIIENFLICIIVVLAMGKSTFIILSVSIAVALIIGKNYQRKNAFIMLVLLALLMYLYSILFPGLFEHHTKIDNFYVSFSQRFYEIFSLLNLPTNLYPDNFDKYYNNLSLRESEYISGYSALINTPSLLLISLIAFFYLISLKKIIKNYSIDKVALLICLFCMLALPIIHPYLKYQLYWFVCGVACLPLFYPFFKIKSSK